MASVYSPLLEHFIHALQCLEGVGPKTARRMAFSLLEKREMGQQLADTIDQAMKTLAPCQRCRMHTEETLCPTCQDQNRQETCLCVVESPADVIAIEQTHSYRGYYFVLNGKLSPLDGQGPKEIGLDVLLQRIDEDNINEVILATSATIEGEATAHYINEQLKDRQQTRCSRLAHGIPLGGELEYLDSGTLGRALQARIHLNADAAID